MKKNLHFLFATLSLLLTFNHLNAQNLNYKVLHDNPDLRPWLSVNLDLLQLDMGVSNIDGTSFNLGAYGFYEPVHRLGVNYNIKFPWLTFGKIANKNYPSNFELDLGGYFGLISYEKTKKTQIVLKKEYKGSTYSSSYDNRPTETVTYIMVPARQKVYIGVRAGLNHKNGPFNYDTYQNDPLYLGDIEETALSSYGIYAGIYKRRLRNVFLDVENYGPRFNSIGDDFFLDVMLFPSNRFSDVNNNNADVSDFVKTNTNASPLGFRVGWMRYQIEKKNRTGKMFGMSGRFEAGYKPYQGWFFNGGIGLTLIKNYKNTGDETAK
ncbi:MAG: hypothetical protein ACKOXB_14705 [Flavobacteriales bacterium]